MTTIFRYAVLVTLIFVILSCKKESADSQALLDSTKQSFTFIKNTVASNEANLLRSVTYSASFEITKVERNKDILLITVTYPDDCSNSRFEVIWNGLVMESYPEIVFFYLRRVSDCKTAATSSSRILSVNLTDKMGDAALAQRVKIILCNTSKKANTENSDISVQVIK